jgi:hypothetical protein
MARAGFTNHVIAAMKAKVGEAHIEGALQRLEAKADNARRHDPIVYYMRMDRLVKIGTSRNIFVRASTIMPQGILAVEWGARAKERDRHSQFIEHHSHGEWYWLREPLWAHIHELREAATTTLGMSVETWLHHQGIRYGQIVSPLGEFE